MGRPSDLFAREVEWVELSRFAEGAPGLGVVYGRRRQGKSWLLRRLVDAQGGLYVQALQHDRQTALRRFGRLLADAVGLADATFEISDWEQAFATARRLLPASGSRLVVLDEYPYLLEHSPELSSVLQAAIDDQADSDPAQGLRYVLCGSAIAVMERLLSGAAPLRGRARLELQVTPFDFRTAAAYWGIDDPRLAMQLDAIVGGTPGYRALVDAEPPAGLDDLPRWLAGTLFNPASALFSEPEYLLREDPRIQDRAVYHAILQAIASGHARPTAIGGAIGRDRTALSYPLDVLTSSGFVTRREDLRRARGATYAIADPVLRFHQLVTRPRITEFEERRWQPAWEQAQPTFRAQILGPHLEHLAREWVRRHASPTTTGGAIGAVGTSVLTDAKRRAKHEIDVLALAAGERTGQRDTVVRLLGEAKDSDRPRGRRDLDRLDAIRDALGRDGADVNATRLALFARSGFEGDLLAVAEERDDVELVDLERLYVGS